MNTYGMRNDVLKSMGYATYQEYLDSQLWMGIRRKAFNKHGMVCFLCGGKANLIHHISYGIQVLQGLELDNLAPLCTPCHEKVEFRGNGKKRTLSESQQVYRRIKRRVTPPDKRHNGRCDKCGKKAKKGMIFCRPCMKGANS